MTRIAKDTALTPAPAVGQRESHTEGVRAVSITTQTSEPTRKPYSTPSLTIHGDMRAITRAIIGGSFNDGTFTGTVDGEPGFS